MPMRLDDNTNSNEHAPIWSLPPNGGVGKSINMNRSQRLMLVLSTEFLRILDQMTNQLRLTDNPDQMLCRVKQLLRSRVAITYAAIDQICRYFYDETKIQKNKIDDYEEVNRWKKANIRNLQRGRKLKVTGNEADQKIAICLDAINGCRTKRDEYMAINRKLRNKVPLEKCITILEDDREVAVLDWAVITDLAC